MCSYVKYQVKINEVNTNDNIFVDSQGSTNKYNFYPIDRQLNMHGDFKIEGEDYIRLFISLSQQVDQYNRSVYSFWDTFGFIGGIYGVLHTIGYLLFNSILKRIFYSDLLAKLYHAEIEHHKPESHDFKYQNKYSDYNNCNQILYRSININHLNKFITKEHISSIDNEFHKNDNSDDSNLADKHHIHEETKSFVGLIAYASNQQNIERNEQDKCSNKFDHENSLLDHIHPLK